MDIDHDTLIAGAHVSVRDHASREGAGIAVASYPEVV
jgi:hypothetical protein